MVNPDLRSAWAEWERRADAAGESLTPERKLEIERIADEVTREGRFSTADLRAALRSAMRGCPACVPEDADDVPDDELVGWLVSHGAPSGIAA